MDTAGEATALAPEPTQVMSQVGVHALDGVRLSLAIGDDVLTASFISPLVVWTLDNRATPIRCTPLDHLCSSSWPVGEHQPQPASSPRCVPTEPLFLR